MTYAVFGSLLVGAGACGKARVELTTEDVALSARTGISQSFVQEIKAYGRNLRQLEGIDAGGQTTKANGVTIDVNQDDALDVVRELQTSAPTGFFAFVSDMNFGLRGEPDQVSVLRVSSPYEALQVMGTNGWNYDLSPELVVARVKQWDQRFGVILRGVGFDWLQAEFKQQPPDMLEFAKEVYQFCPDVVDQGTETVEALASEMKRTNSVYLWWD